MSEIITPDMIVAELREVRALASRGSEAIAPAESAFDTAEAVWQNVYDIAYELAEGTVALREIAARRAAKDQKLVMDVARVELNRIKAKIRQLESSQSNLQTQWKAIAITYAEAGR
jgi:hypothetical protein